MALTRDQLIELARANAKASLNPSVAYSFGGEKLSAEALNKTFIKELFFRIMGSLQMFVHSLREQNQFIKLELVRLLKSVRNSL